MSLKDWETARRNEVFIPIDYSADLNSILATVPWALLMKGGLGILAKFKVFIVGEDDVSEENSLPSWVINWRSISSLFVIERYLDSKRRPVQKLDEIWHTSYPIHSFRGQRYPPLKLFPSPPPHVHTEFCEDNMNNLIGINKLILRGIVQNSLYIKGDVIWGKRKLLPDKAIQRVNNILPTDLIVAMLRLVTGHWRTPTLWILRPLEIEEFRLEICLSDILRCQIYRHWVMALGDFPNIPRSYSDRGCRSLTFGGVSIA